MQRVQDPIIPHIGALIRATPGTISLGQGVVHFSPPERARRRAAEAWTDPRTHHYSAVDGVLELKECIARKLAADNGIDATGRCITVTAGANMAFLNALFVVTEPGDEIILPAPYYFNHEMAITMLGCRPVPVPVDDRHQIDLQRLEYAITPRTRAIVTVSPNNPTGAVYARPVLEHINALCGRRGIYHVSDEAYEYFTYDGVAHFSPGSIEAGSPHTISLFSLSKSFGFAGWRIGYMVAPEGLAPAIAKAQDTNLICPPVVSQHAAIGALEAGAAYPASFIDELSAVRRLVLDALDGLPDRCRAPRPDGAFYVFLRIDTNQTPLELAETLITKHRVAVIPGSAFGVDTGCTLRIAYGALKKETVAEGIGRLVEGLRTIG